MVSCHLRILRGLCLLAVVGVVLGCTAPPPKAVQTPPPPVTVSQPVSRSDVVDYDRYEGRLAAVEKVELRARVRGHLTKVAFSDGDMVKKGDLLFEIDPRQYRAALDAATAQVKASEATVEFAKAEYNRVRTLVSRKAASLEEMDTWVAKQATAKGELLKARASEEEAQLNLDFSRITAPISGRISRAQITVGNLINAGGGDTLLTTLVSVDPMYVYFDVDERSLLRYRRLAAAAVKDGEKRVPLREQKIPVQVALEGESGYPHQGVIDFADNRVNPGTGTIQVRGVLVNKTGLFEDGMRARVRIPIGDPRPALLVTERAIGTDQGRKYVYVVNDKNRVERRDVTLDRVVDGLQVIAEGIKPGEWIIVNGIQRVRDGLEVNPNRTPMPGSEALSSPSGKAKSSSAPKAKP